MAELDVRHFLLPELRFELEVAKLALRQADRVLPVAEVVDPFVEVAELADHQWLLLDSAVAMRWRASGVVNSSFCCAISRSSMDASELPSLAYSASLARRTAAGGWAAHSSAVRRVPVARPACGTTPADRPGAHASPAGTTPAPPTSSSAPDVTTRRGAEKRP